MAARKETIWQRDFSLGSVRPEALERDDTNVIEASTEECTNTVTLSTGQLQGRPGLLHLGQADSAKGFEVSLGDGEVFDLVFEFSGLKLYDSDNNLIVTVAVDWVDLADIYNPPSFNDMEFWVVPDPDRTTIIIGSKAFAPQRLYYWNGAWQFGEYAFATTATGAIGLPFWRHYPRTAIRPSGTTGSITVTATAGVFTDKHEGAYIRYVDRQIRLDTRVSSTVFNATVIEELPPTYDITVANASGFQVDDAVEAENSGGQGVISAINGSVITVLVTKNYSSFGTGEQLVGPNAASDISVVTGVTSATTFLWDMQMWNAEKGYPGAAASHGGRLFLCNYRTIPLGFAASVAGDVQDFTMGTEDADGFAESLSSEAGGALKYMLSAEDLLFFTTRGLFYQTTRDGSVITPLTIRPVRFSRYGCGTVPPVAIDDGAVFVDSSGQNVHAAVLAGDIYRSWRVRQISKFGSHVVQSPIALGATASGSQRPELFVVATLEDGDLAVAQWDRENDISGDLVSWRRWDTNGNFKNVYQVENKLQAIVSRDIGGTFYFFRERFEDFCRLDCATTLFVSEDYPTGEPGFERFDALGALATHLNGETCPIYFKGFDMGDRVIVDGRPEGDTAGQALTYPDGQQGTVQIGFNYEINIVPWSRRSARTSRGVRSVKRLVEIYVSVRATGIFEVNGKEYNGYRVGEDLTEPPPTRELQVRQVIFSREDPYERIPITRSRPGPFTLTKLGFRVTV